MGVTGKKRYPTNTHYLVVGSRQDFEGGHYDPRHLGHGYSHLIPHLLAAFSFHMVSVLVHLRLHGRIKLVPALKHLRDSEVPIVAIIPATRGVDKEVPDFKIFACDWFPKGKSVCDSSNFFVSQPCSCHFYSQPPRCLLQGHTLSRTSF